RLKRANNDSPNRGHEFDPFLVEEQFLAGFAWHDFNNASFSHASHCSSDGVKRVEKIAFHWTVPLEVHPDLVVVPCFFIFSILGRKALRVPRLLHLHRNFRAEKRIGNLCDRSSWSVQDSAIKKFIGGVAPLA